MRKINFLLLLTITAVMLLPGQEQKAPKTRKVKKKYIMHKAAAYQKEELLISATDMYCTYFIRKSLSEDLVVSSAQDVELEKEYFSDGERLYINKGSNDGINEKDVFLVIEKGSKIHNRLNSKTLGTFYQKKALAEVVRIYEDKSLVIIKRACHPVHLGDILVPYQEQEPVFEKKIDYQKSRLPESGIEGNVVYLHAEMGVDREISGPSTYVTIDLGKAMASKGDWLLLYKIFNADLPPMIIGSALVIDSQNTNSTVKIIENAVPVTVGIKLVLFQVAAEKTGKKADDADEFEEIVSEQEEMEEIPIIDTQEKAADSPEAKEKEKTLKINVFFDINKTSVKDKYKKELEKIKPFIDARAAYTVILRGYACNIGGLEYNLKLSKKRVESVKKHLMEKYNIKEEFFETYHYGEKDTPFDNTKKDERKKNRLVNIEVIGK